VWLMGHGLGGPRGAPLAHERSMIAGQSTVEHEPTGEARSRTSRWRRDTCDAVHLELLIAFMPLYVFFLGLIRIGLLFMARLLTEHTAATAARAAAVAIAHDGDSVHDYGDEEKHWLDPDDKDAKTMQVENLSWSAVLSPKMVAAAVHPQTGREA
jgi:hypothetical protein